MIYIGRLQLSRMMTSQAESDRMLSIAQKPLVGRGFLASNQPSGSAEIPFKVRWFIYGCEPHVYRILFTIGPNPDISRKN
jgi:hypothetical protein